MALHIYDIFVLNSYYLSSKYGINKSSALLTNQLLTKRLPIRPFRVSSKVNSKKTRYECAVCREKPSLRVGGCFKDYHSKE